MRKYIVLNSVSACILVCMIASSGCVKYTGTPKGQFPHNQIGSLIKPGENTKSDVEELIGPPLFVTFSDRKKELWTYYYTTIETAEKPMFIWEAFNEETCDKMSYTDYHILTITFSKTGTVEELLVGTARKGRPWDVRLF